MSRTQAGLVAGASLLAVLLAGCQREPMGGPLALQIEANEPVAALQRINEAGAKCWVRSSDADFRDLHLVPELDTSVGRPRLLLLKKGKAEGLPVLVIEAAGSPVTLTTYGPLASTRTGGRVNADIMRWSSGRTTCRS
ncbi:hypothetical protein [Chelativorans salis]|uniref:Lipoprotein n=1 Tax=Chelativorans salis TaxID=2978478 RepID=A0ABT2LKR0_9HYPH|nr:hypothetical protein [Chelativorans sp. EGI FJ00035]MCT7375187.1 hypothetical protein [Chelativorans sp. EGI FJ00035]